MVQLNGPALGFFCFPSLPRIQVVSKLLYPCGEGTGLQWGIKGCRVVEGRGGARGQLTGTPWKLCPTLTPCFAAVRLCENPVSIKGSSLAPDTQRLLIN